MAERTLDAPSISTTHVDGVAVVALSGEHDLTTVAEFRAALAELTAHARIVIDLTDATFIDSTTIGTILESRDDSTPVGNAVVLVAPRGGEPRRVLDLLQIGDRVRVFPNRELAIVALMQRPLTAFVKRRGISASVP